MEKAEFAHTKHLVRPGQIPQIPIHQSPAHLRLRDMDEIPLHGVVQVIRVDHLPIQQTALAPPNLPAPLLVNEQPAAELLRLDLEKASQLLQVHGGVKFEVRFDGGIPHRVLHFFHEDAEMVLDGVDVDLGVVEVGRGGADEFGAGRAEEVFEEREGVRSASLQSVELVAVLLSQRGVNRIVQPGGAEAHADGDQSVHLVVFLRDAVVLRVLLEVLGPRDVHEDVAEHADGVGVAAHHHVRETDVVICSEVGGHDASEHGFLVELDVIQCLQCQAEVAEQAMHAE